MLFFVLKFKKMSRECVWPLGVWSHFGYYLGEEGSHATLVSRSFRRIDYGDGTTGNRLADTRYNTILQYSIQRYTEIDKQEQGWSCWLVRDSKLDQWPPHPLYLIPFFFLPFFLFLPYLVLDARPYGISHHDRVASTIKGVGRGGTGHGSTLCFCVCTFIFFLDPLLVLGYTGYFHSG